MKKYRLVAAAEADLDAIWEYIADDSPVAASRWSAKIFEAFEALARTPGMGHKRRDLTSLPFLFWPVGTYLIVYRENGGLVEVAAVLQGSQDILSLLQGRSM